MADTVFGIVILLLLGGYAVNLVIFRKKVFQSQPHPSKWQAVPLFAVVTTAIFWPYSPTTLNSYIQGTLPLRLVVTLAAYTLIGVGLYIDHVVRNHANR